jgi:2-iminoacetate synthase ThiH
MQDPVVLKRVLASANSLGYARAERWSPGIPVDTGFAFAEPITSSQTSCSKVDPELTQAVSASITEHMGQHSKTLVGIDGTISQPRHLDRGMEMSEVTQILEKIATAVEPTEAEVTRLFYAMGPDFRKVVTAADQLRSRVKGERVTYVVNRNINYTNVCGYRCQFCAFSKGKHSEDLRGKPYRLSLEEIASRAAEAWERGATEVCMQGGIHPEFTGDTYLEILRAVKNTVPDIHVHAFSPLEVFQGASTLGVSVQEFLVKLKNAGLGSLPGTAAEVLDDEVRSMLCPDKITTNEWLEIMETAHVVGLKTTSTIMFGHLDSPHHWYGNHPGQGHVDSG